MFMIWYDVHVYFAIVCHFCISRGIVFFVELFVNMAKNMKGVNIGVLNSFDKHLYCLVQVRCWRKVVQSPRCCSVSYMTFDSSDQSVQSRITSVGLVMATVMMIDRIFLSRVFVMREIWPLSALNLTEWHVWVCQQSIQSRNDTGQSQYH